MVGNSHLIEQTVGELHWSLHGLYVSYLSFPCFNKTHCLCVPTEEKLYCPSPLLLQQFLHMGTEVILFSLVCVQLYPPVDFLGTGVLEPPGTLAWPTEINCARRKIKPQEAFGHFSELSKHQLIRIVLLGGTFNYLDNLNYLDNSLLYCPFHHSVFCKFLLIFQSFVWKNTPQFLQ